MEEKNIKGIEGWLLFYVIILIFYLILLSFLAFSSFTERDIYTWEIGGFSNIPLSSFVFIPLMIFSIITIFRKSRLAIMLNKILIGLFLLAVILAFRQALSYSFFNTVIVAGVSITWFLYWSKSKRVKNTFMK